MITDGSQMGGQLRVIFQAAVMVGIKHQSEKQVQNYLSKGLPGESQLPALQEETS